MPGHGSARVEVFDIPTSLSRFQELCDPHGGFVGDALARYRERLDGAAMRAGISLDPRALLRRQMQLFADHGFRAELPIYRRILRKPSFFRPPLGNIQEAGCLETLLLSKHLNRHPEQSRPTEFFALVLEKIRPGDPTLRIYFASGGESSAPPLDLVLKELKDDLRDGWRMRAHLHNHFVELERLETLGFGSGDPVDIAGTLIPSQADRRSFLSWKERFGLKEGWITNGLHTLRIQAGQFKYLRQGLR